MVKASLLDDGKHTRCLKRRKGKERERERETSYFCETSMGVWIEEDEEREIFGKKQFVLNVDRIKFTVVNVIIPPKWEFDIVSQF